MMKRLLVIIICLSFFLTTVDVTDARIIQNDVVAFEGMIEPLSPTRIYGEDISGDIFREVSLESFRNFIIKLTENGSRWITAPEGRSDANRDAQSWIAQELVRVSDGRIEVEIIGDHHSVVGRLPGYFPYDAPALLVGGHYDSVIDSPGANDDGTGVATMLELARVLSQYEWPLDIYFGAWNAEEIGLVGASEVAQEFISRGIDILVHYNIDMLFVKNPYAPDHRLVLMAYPDMVYQEGRYWAEQTMIMSRQYGDGMIIPIASSDFSGWERSDHWAFITQGYRSSLFAHESGFSYDSAYHTINDRWDNPIYNYTVAIEVVKAIGASLAYSMSREYQQLTREEVRFILGSEESRVFYIPVSTPTSVNVSCRWWGGEGDFVLRNPSDVIIGSSYNSDSSAWEPIILMNPSVSMLGLHTLTVYNPGSTMTGYELVFEYDTDVDGDYRPDSQDFWFDPAFFTLDSDSDSIGDAYEYIIGTSVNSADSDSDSITDSWELNHGLNPLDAGDAELDYDSDGVLNIDEFLNNCNPYSPDSDQDEMPDLWEIENNLDPTYDDASEDPDNDAVSNLDEYLEGTDPHYAELRLERLFVPSMSIGVIAVIIIGTYVVRLRY
ncbi:MAG: M28 family metallopeptidase [Candidatus Thorarchaeota archaeon]